MAWPRPANGLGGAWRRLPRCWGQWGVAGVSEKACFTHDIDQFDATCVENVLVRTGCANDVDINKKAVRNSNGFFLRAENET